MEMFEKASRLEIRYDTAKGQLTVEDLWKLPLLASNRVHLDEIARGLHKQLKNDDDVSFVLKDKKSDEVTQLKFDIARHIIEVRLAEEEAAKKTRENKEKKQRLLQLIAEKQDEELKGRTVDELTSMVNAIED